MRVASLEKKVAGEELIIMALLRELKISNEEVQRLECGNKLLG